MVLGRDSLGVEADKGLTLVEIPEDLEQFRLSHGPDQAGVERAQDTPAHGDQMGAEGHGHRLPRQQAQFLLHLRVVAVLRHLIGPEALVDFAVLGGQRRLAAGAAGSRTCNRQSESSAGPVWPPPEGPTPG